MTKLSEDEAKILLGLGSERGVHFIIAGDHQYLAKTRTGIPKYIKETIQTSLITMRLTDQDYAESPYLSREPELEMTSANYSFDQQFIKVKYPV